MEIWIFAWETIKIFALVLVALLVGYYGVILLGDLYLYCSRRWGDTGCVAAGLLLIMIALSAILAAVRLYGD